MRGPRSSFRRAVAASLVLHAGLAVVAIVAARWPASPRQPAAAPIDTRVDEPRITFVTAVEKPVTVTVPDPPAASDPGDSNPPSAPAPEPVPSGPPLAPAPSVPSTPPPELLPLPKQPAAPVGPAVIEVPLTPSALHPPPAPAPSPEVRPAGGTSAPAGNADPTATPVHGALRPGQTIVYVLDASGSMGEWGKFASARRALIATLRAQPESVRVQVVVYSSTAQAVLPGGCVPATAANVARIEQSLSGKE